MYATNGVTDILGLGPHQLISRNLFYCIQERCLRHALRCLESAKANDSIAFLRFWFRNPLLDEDVDLEKGGYSSAAFGIPTDPYARASAPVELEAVVSCTSDGLVVILRRARAPIPSATLPPQPVPVYSYGLFAAPWALEPLCAYGFASCPHDSLPNPAYPEAKSSLCKENQISSLCQGPTPAPSSRNSSTPTFLAEAKSGASRPHENQLMNTIRDVAVFACGIIGIHRSLEQHKYGPPSGNAHPDAMADDNWDNEATAGRNYN